jgi:hypothetical protein
MGAVMNMSVVDPTHTSALVIAHTGSFAKLLPSGYVWLVDYNLPRLFRLPMALPSAGVNINVPMNLGMCGLTAYTQAVLLGGGGGFALSNAIDLTIGI